MSSSFIVTFAYANMSNKLHRFKYICQGEYDKAKEVPVSTQDLDRKQAGLLINFSRKKELWLN